MIFRTDSVQYFARIQILYSSEKFVTWKRRKSRCTPRLPDIWFSQPCTRMTPREPFRGLSIAQRLIRKLCEFCKAKTDPAPEEKKIIDQHLKNMPAAYKPAVPKTLNMYKAVGCQKCNETGYKGRIGIFEGFLVDDEMERLIITNPPAADIQQTAVKKGMLTMYQDGIIKVIRGLTSFEELNRVVSEN